MTTRLESISTSLANDVRFMREADGVTMNGSGEMSGVRGGRGMTSAEARLTLEHLAGSGVSNRELGIAIRDLPGLSASERAMLTSALAARGGVESSPGLTDVQSGPGGNFNAASGRAWVEGFVATSHQFNDVVLESSPSGGGRVNYTIHGENDPSRPAAAFTPARATSAADYLLSHGMNKQQALAAVNASSISDADKALLRQAIQSHA